MLASGASWHNAGIVGVKKLTLTSVLMEPAGHTATLSLIPSLGAFTRSCFVPR
jgi:hypothetical protein